MHIQRLSFLALLFLFIGFVSPVRAQMTDDQVIQYVQQGLQAGKSQVQIGKELLLKGVSRSQLERLRENYGGSASDSDSESGYGNSRSRSSMQSRTRTRSSMPERWGESEDDGRYYYDRRTGSSSRNDRYRRSSRYDRSDRYDRNNRNNRADSSEESDDFEYADDYRQDSYGFGLDGLVSDSLSFDFPMGMGMMRKKRSVPDTLQKFGHNIFSDRDLTFEPNENLATPENYQLGPGDEVFIDIWGANEANIRQEISPEGDIMVEQLGPVYLNGLTIKEANSKIRRIFAQRYAEVIGENPLSDIRVTLGEIRSILVSVMGEVHTPGTYRLSAFASLFHALYGAGGVTDIGSLRNIRVMRNGEEVASADLYEYLFEGKMADDIRLKEGDVIVVPPYEAQVTVQGKVKRPMYYEVKKGEPLAALLKYAGGFAGDAYSKEVGLFRQTGQEHRIFSVGENKFDSFGLEDGDSVRVGATLNRFANRVEVQGAVFRPGMYELSDELNTVRALVERAEGLKEDAFVNRAQLFREKEDLTKEMLAVDLHGIMTGQAPDVALRRNDVLVVPSIQELQEFGAFTIDGEVAWPGHYPYADNTTIEDLIIQAGGLLESASTAQVDVMRRLRSPKSKTPSEEVGKVYSFEIKDGFVIDGKEPFTLEPFDVVEVRRSPGYQKQRLVILDGEVVFEGRYALVRKNERISDLVNRAGGVTPDAYTRGGRLIRRMNEEERAVREATILAARQKQNNDSVSLERLTINDYYNVGIELDKALENPGSDYDVILREGDRLVIPEFVSTVTINGEVMSPNTVTYLKDKKLKYYISQVGGYADRAKKNKVYVVYMNGMIAQAKGSTRIEPGCEIVVPSKRKRNPVRLSELLGLTTSAASIAAVIVAAAK